MIQLDASSRAARMLAAGRLTVTFRSPTGTHITLTAKCRAPQDDGRWVGSSLADAKVVFIEVPNQEGWNDKVAKVTRAKGLVPDPNADEARAYCARMLLRYVAGETLPTGLEVFEEDRCGRCGRALTDPVSIERGIGPECYGKETGSTHETKHRPEPTAAEFAAEHGSSPDAWAEQARREREDDEGPTEAEETGIDRQGVPLASGDWRRRKQIARSAVADSTGGLHGPRMTALLGGAAPGHSQMVALPGETWEDIFGGAR